MMSDDVVGKIRKAELEAEGIIEGARREAHMETGRARRGVEEDLIKFEKNAQEELKAFREEKKALYQTEAEDIRKEGERIRGAFRKDIEKKIPEIKATVDKLVRKELCP